VPDPADEAAGEAALDPASPPSAEALGGRFLAIYEIGRQLLESRDPAEVIRAIQDAVAEHLRPDHACALAVHPDGRYRPLATLGLDLSGPQDAWPISRTVLARVREQGLAVLSTDVRADAAFEPTGSVHRLRIRSVLCVPLGPRAAQGLLYLDRRGEGRGFTRADLEFLTAIARYASRVLERTAELRDTSAALVAQRERLQAAQEELLRHEIVGRTPALLAAYDTVRRLARSGARVLLRGETGTGKELFARAYAAHSGRQDGPYVPVPIPALAPGLLESELFGHVRGAFTEATRDKKGRLELAHGGVLFLDEVGDVEPALQPKLLRFLDSGEIYRVGDTDQRRVDARIVSATNRPLERDLAEGRLRADLLARLGHQVHVPPLRQRRDDVPLLAEHFLGRFHRGPQPRRLSDEALAVLRAHDWPFNVRELQMVVESAVSLSDRDVLGPEDLPPYLRGEAARSEAPPAAEPGAPPRAMREVLDEAERLHIERALRFTNGNKRQAIELLRVSPDTFYKRLREFGLREPR
jgi:transcriptional regulator with GAF, ATPase, and Fis domain